jgi:hypothetical protein
MPFRLRTPVAVFCIAIAIFAPCVPSVVLTVPVADLAPAWLYQAPAAAILGVDAPRVAEQTASLLERLPSRAPPVARLTA